MTKKPKTPVRAMLKKSSALHDSVEDGLGGRVLLRTIVAAVALVVGATLPPGAFIVALITPDPQQDLDFTPHVLVGLVGCGLFLYGVGSVARLAKPQSRWARQFYSEERMERARARFGDR